MPRCRLGTGGWIKQKRYARIQFGWKKAKARAGSRKRHTKSRSNLFINFCSKILSPKAMRVNSAPKPSAGAMFRTIAPARTLPPGTSNAILSSVPTGGGLGVEMDNHTMRNVLIGVVG